MRYDVVAALLQAFKSNRFPSARKLTFFIRCNHAVTPPVFPARGNALLEVFKRSHLASDSIMTISCVVLALIQRPFRHHVIAAHLQVFKSNRCGSATITTIFVQLHRRKYWLIHAALTPRCYRRKCRNALTKVFDRCYICNIVQKTPAQPGSRPICQLA
jgi:hypothetical protein